MKNRTKIAASLGILALSVSAALAGCSSTGNNAGDGGTDGESDTEAGTIALLLPESKTSRYEQFDRPFFEAKVEALGGGEVLYSNADQDASKQQNQAESALAAGAQVLVLDPVDAEAAASIVAAASAQGVPVLSYDRLIAGGEAAFYVSFDAEKVGELQGQALVDKLDEDGASGGVLMINGSPTDSNAGLFKSGAHSAIDASNYEVLAEYDTPDWSPDKAQEWTTGQITQYAGQIAGIYAANDGMAGGAIAALKADGVDPLPIITGQDAELTAIQSIVAGDQYMTIYKAIKQEAELAAEIAVKLAAGEDVSGEANTEVDGVPTTLLAPIAVTVDNIMETVVADDFWSVDQVCTAEYAAACAAADIQ